MTFYFKWFLKLWKNKKKSMIFIFFLTIVTISVKTAFPLILKYLIDYLKTDYDINVTYRFIFYFVIGAIIKESLSHILPYFRGKLNGIFGGTIRQNYYKLITNKNSDFFKSYKTGDLLTRLTDHIDGNEQGIYWYSCSGIFRPIEATLLLIFTLSTMIYFSIPLTLISFLPLPFIIIILAKYEHKIISYTEKRQQAVTECNNVLETCLSGIKVIKTTISEKEQLKKYDSVLKNRVQKEKDFLKINQIIHFLSMFVNNLGTIIVIFAGSIMLVKNQISLGTFLLFITFMQTLIEPIWTLSYFYASSKSTFRYVDRLVEIENIHNIDDNNKNIKINAFSNLNISNLFFKFEDTNKLILKNININIKKGEKIAVVGKVGAGKTTLLNLITGNIKPISGEISFNKNNIDFIDKNSLMKIIGYVTQENLMFSGSIKENINLGDSFNTNNIEDMLKISLIDEEIENMPQKINTVLGQKGVNISGGQKQRLSLARTLIRKPTLLILDDVTAAMDAKTENLFWEKINENIPNITAVVVTHRMITAKNMDKILVLDKGEIVEQGTHEELLKTGSFYKQIINEK